MIRHIAKLFVNHVDAWGVTSIIGCLALFLHDAITLKAIVLVLVLATGYWLGFAVNDYYDAPFDAQDARKAARNFFASYHLPGWMIGITVALVFGLFLGIFIFGFGVKGIAVFAASGLVVWGYSAPPLRLKSRPVVDLLTHMLFVQTFPYWLCMFLLELRWMPFDTVLIAVFMLASLSAQLEQQARDYEVDKQTDGNFTTRFGLRTTATLLKLTTALLLLVVAASLSMDMFPHFMIPFGLIALPIMLHRLLRDIHTPRSETLVRLSVLAALAYAGMMWAGLVLQ